MCKSCFCFLLILFFGSCIKNELDDVKLDNPLDPQVGGNTFIVDSVSFDKYRYARLYFRVNLDLIKDPSKIKNVYLYRDTVVVMKYKNAPQFKYLDTQTLPEMKINYRFRMEDYGGNLSIRSSPYTITVPK